MDEPERIPIDIGGALASIGQVSTAEVASPPAGAVTQREDGSLVIDILVPQPCQPSGQGEIVVCASVAESVRYPAGDAPAPEPTLMEALKQALSTRIGPVEVGPGAGGIQVRIRF